MHSHYSPEKMNYTASILNDKTIDPSKWSALVEKAPGGVPFGLCAFNNATGDQTFYIVISDKGGDYLAGGVFRLRGKLPLAGNFFASLWLDSAAMVDESAVGQDQVRALKAAIYEGIIAYARKRNLVQVFLTHWSRETDRALLEQAGFTVEENPTIEIDLSGDPDALYSNLKSSNKRLVKQAQQCDTRVGYSYGPEAQGLLPQLQMLRQETQRRALRKNSKASMLLKSDSFLDRLLSEMQDKAIVGSAENDGKTSAAILLLAAAGKAYYYIGGSDYEVVKHTRSSNLLHWECIKYLKKQGFRIYDLGGIPYNPDENHPAYGVYRFKKSFGGEEKMYYSGHCLIQRHKYLLYKWVLSNSALKRTLSKILSR